MQFDVIVSPSLTDLFINQMEQHIISGAIKPGEKLPTERKLAEEMNVSLAVVNAGIRRLSESGLLQIVPRKGVYVADFVRCGNVSTLRAILNYGGAYYQSDLLEALVNFRRAYETEVIREAVKKCTEEDITRLVGIKDEFIRCENLTKRSDVAYEFHHEIAIASKNVVYALITATFRLIYVSSYQTVMNILGIQNTVDLMEETIACFKNRDADGAVAVLYNSIDRWNKCISRNFSEGQTYPGRSEE